MFRFETCSEVSCETFDLPVPVANRLFTAATTQFLWKDMFGTRIASFLRLFERPHCFRRHWPRLFDQSHIIVFMAVVEIVRHVIYGPAIEASVHNIHYSVHSGNGNEAGMNLVRTAMLLALMTALFMMVGYALGGSGGMIVALIAAMVMNVFSWWNSDKLVLRMHNAVEADEQNAPEFFSIIRALAERAGLPMPRVYLINSDQPNAFATGRNPQNAAVAASTGLLNHLTKEEVAGVMAHELAHIQSRDTLTMTITATLAGAISMLGNFAFFFGGNRNNNSPLGGLGSLFAIIVAPIAAMIVQMAVSRTREYAADRRGAEITGNPLWLASALKKIAAATKLIPNYRAERFPASAHMFIINPLFGLGADGLFSTHPATENRVAALEEMAGEFSGVDMADSSPQAAEPSAPVETPPPAPGPWGRNAAPKKGPWA